MTEEKPLPIGCLNFSNVVVGKSESPTDYFDKNHPLVVKYTKELKDQINELQQKNDLLQLDFNAAQEVMGGMNQEKEELIKAFNFIRSSDSSTESATKAIEILKKYE